MKQLTIPMTRRELTWGWVYYVLQLLFLPLLLEALNTQLPTPLTEAQLNFTYFAVNFAVLTVIFHRFLGLNFKQATYRLGYTLQSAFFGYGIYYLSTLVISFVIARCAPDFANLNDDSIAQMLRENYTLTTVGTVILVPVAEELMYRGLIFRALYNRSRFAAYAVSTLVFAGVHLLGYITVYDPLSLALALLQYLPAGLCLGWAYARSNTIWAPILIHMAVNQIGLLSMR